MKQRNAALDKRLQLRETEHVHARRRELDGERQSVHAPDDRRGLPSALGVELEARSRGTCAFEEQGPRPASRHRRLRSRPPEGNGSDCDPDLARHVEHLTARRQHPYAWTAGDQFFDHAPHLGEQSLARIEQENRLRVAQALDHTIQLIAATSIHSTNGEVRLTSAGLIARARSTTRCRQRYPC